MCNLAASVFLFPEFQILGVSHNLICDMAHLNIYWGDSADMLPEFSDGQKTHPLKSSENQAISMRLTAVFTPDIPQWKSLLSDEV